MFLRHFLLPSSSALKGSKEGGHGSVALPDTCLAKIMSCLAGTLQPGGLRGPSAVAKDLAQASLVRRVVLMHSCSTCWPGSTNQLRRQRGGVPSLQEGTSLQCAVHLLVYCMRYILPSSTSGCRATVCQLQA